MDRALPLSKLGLVLDRLGRGGRRLRGWHALAARSLEHEGFVVAAVPGGGAFRVRAPGRALPTLVVHATGHVDVLRTEADLGGRDERIPRAMRTPECVVALARSVVGRDGPPPSPRVGR